MPVQIVDVVVGGRLSRQVGDSAALRFALRALRAFAGGLADRLGHRAVSAWAQSRTAASNSRTASNIGQARDDHDHDVSDCIGRRRRSAPE